MTDLQTFINTIPDKITRSRVVREIQNYKFPYKTEVALRAYAQHDALHYLFNQPFTKEGEKKRLPGLSINSIVGGLLWMKNIINSFVKSLIVAISHIR